MHDTAFQIGTLAMNIYTDLPSASVLEVGSQALNGSLREVALPSTHYVGVDIEEGPGVDVVVAAGSPLPLEDGSFDLVMATSVFEHDPFFWMTFLEMCRKTREGGYVYINAPSNGVVHRYPKDNWRFYPDSGTALAQWAVSQGQHVTLVESFIANREADIWNDFAAVFRKGRITKTLPKVFIHQHVPCSNVITWKSKKISKENNEPEDLVLLREALRRAEAAELELAEVSTHKDRLAEEVRELGDKAQLIDELSTQRDRLAQEVGELRDKAQRIDAIGRELRRRENELAQRQEEIEQTRSELCRVRSERDRLSMDLLSIEAEVESQRRKLHDAQTNYSDAQAALNQEQAAVRQERAKKDEAIARLEASFEELATLTRMLQEGEEREGKASQQIEWLRETAFILANGSKSPKARLRSILPAVLDQKRERNVLKRRGLFDGESYLTANPDVAADAVDPLRHYLKHGIGEDRPRS